MSDRQQMPRDLRAEAMKANLSQYSGVKSMQDPEKNPTDSVISVKPEDNSKEPR